MDVSPLNPNLNMIQGASSFYNIKLYSEQALFLPVEHQWLGEIHKVTPSHFF